VSEQNVCRFVPREINDHSIHTVHFVLETKEQVYTGLRLKALYTVYFVTQGEGKLHTKGEVRTVKQGDVFFSFPAEPFAIESVSDFRYMYISFLGARGNRILDKLGISPKTPAMEDCGELVTVGSDAHNPIHAGLGIPEACELLKSLGFKAVCTYEKRKPIFHDL